MELGEVKVHIFERLLSVFLPWFGGFGFLVFVVFLEEPVEDDEVVVLGDEAAQVIVFFQETDEFFGGTVVREFFGSF